MTLPASGAISLGAIQTEFGGSNPISLSEYYRGGPYTTSNNTGVPTSGAISISQFYGGVAADYVPDAIAWADFYDVTDDQSGYNDVASSTQSITGITHPITLSVATTNWSMSSGGGVTCSGGLAVYVNGIVANSIIHSGSSAAMTFSASNNDTIQFVMDVSVSHFSSYATGASTATWSVTNTSNGNALLDAFAGTVGASTSGGV